MSTPQLIPGHPNIKQLGFVNPYFFVTVYQSEPDTIFGTNHVADIGRTDGSAERITYVTFNVPPMSEFPGANAETKAFLVPLPDTVDPNGSKVIETFDLQPGFQLPASFTFDTRPEPNNNLASITYGGASGVTPIEMDIFVEDVPNYGGTQAFEVRATGDNANITFSTNPVNTHPNGMVLVIANVS